MTRSYSGYVQDEQLRFVGEHHPILGPIALKSSGSEQTLAAGTVLGRVTADGLYVQLDPAAEDGSQAAARILAETTVVPASGNEAANGYRHGEFYDSGLTWPDGIDAAKKQTAIDELEAQGVYVV
ncbi:head decoration protein [Pseudodesulfovibrio thermohalotolerans]|uniref:head decoration protein n=1 Tax=Pseudodesulfovibrio thermohalotolerans TaxID=2880651 RepID=UPI0022B9D668|nr:head decoration protein [Pseudodesulfovibrio thermohalotolerans]WFS63450.1 head decoration protein [Pseudodesulfovibrio thermohalotolerans]